MNFIAEIKFVWIKFDRFLTYKPGLTWVHYFVCMYSVYTLAHQTLSNVSNLAGQSNVPSPWWVPECTLPLQAFICVLAKLWPWGGNFRECIAKYTCNSAEMKAVKLRTGIYTNWQDCPQSSFEHIVFLSAMPRKWLLCIFSPKSCVSFSFPFFLPARPWSCWLRRCSVAVTTRWDLARRSAV